MSTTANEPATAKHSPEPWETDEQCCMVFIPVRDESREDKPRFAVACATDELQPTAGFYSTFDERTPGEAKANMRLISAAPDLLKALQGVLRVADRKTVEFDAARDAIKKALGS